MEYQLCKHITENSSFHELLRFELAQINHSPEFSIFLRINKIENEKNTQICNSKVDNYV